jgi:hypothetical protein
MSDSASTLHRVNVWGEWAGVEMILSFWVVRQKKFVRLFRSQPRKKITQSASRETNKNISAVEKRSQFQLLQNQGQKPPDSCSGRRNLSFSRVFVDSWFLAPGFGKKKSGSDSCIFFPSAVPLKSNSLTVQ